MRLINGNVERIAVSERDIVRLKAEGFKELGGVETSPSSTPETVNLSALDVSQLKTIAKEKGIAGYSSLTKTELLATLKDVM